MYQETLAALHLSNCVWLGFPGQDPNVLSEHQRWAQNVLLFPSFLGNSCFTTCWKQCQHLNDVPSPETEVHFHWEYSSMLQGRHGSSFCHLQTAHWVGWGSGSRRHQYCFHSNLQVLQGCVFMTGPKVLRNGETSMLWFGISGIWMARRVLGFTPKLFLFNWIAKSHVLQSFVGEAHFQKHVPLAMDKCFRNQAFTGGNHTGLGATYPPGALPVPVESSNTVTPRPS